MTPLQTGVRKASVCQLAVDPAARIVEVLQERKL